MGSKRFLAIETSSPRLSLAIGNEDGVIATITGKHDWRHAEHVFDGIKTLLKKAKATVQSLSGVAVSTGPGSFTGIRIGLSLARTLGQSLKIPVAGVDSLQIIAAGAGTSAMWLAPQIDALRDQVFSALYEKTSQGILRCAISPGMALAKEWPKMAQRRARNGKLWLPSLATMPFPEARILLRLATPALLKGSKTSYKEVLPLYIRRAAAEERLG